MDEKIYVLVRHVSGRCFTLNRRYKIIDKDKREKVPGYVDIWEGWMPEAQSRPEWANSLPKEEFTAYWLF